MSNRYGITIPFDTPLGEQKDLYKEFADLGYTDLWSSEADGADGGAAAALGCLRRAEALAAEAEIAPLRLQILRQTRAQLVQMGKPDEARRCEATIDEVRAALEAPERDGATEIG